MSAATSQASLIENSSLQTILNSSLAFDPHSSKCKNKPVKAMNSAVRAGDWVCFVCNNLNFSFRDECNRCQNQTKQQNFLQSLLLSSTNAKPDISAKSDRLPFRDITNIQKPLENFEDNSYFFPSSEENTSFDGETKEIFVTNNETNFDFSSNYGFENVLLLTPPKVRGEKNQNSENDEEELPAYQSPKKLPSVTEILKKVASENFDKSKIPRELMKIKVSTSDQIKFSSPSSFCFTTTAKIQEVEGLSDSTKDPLDESSEDENSHNLNIIELLKDDEMDNPVPLSRDPIKAFQQILSKLPQVTNVKESANEPPKNIKVMKQDWICPHCANLNYSFRKYCNRCQIKKSSS